MAKSLTHFEIFLRKTPRASWVLTEALEGREAAIKCAHGLLKENPSGGVRVTKESLNQDTGNYDSVVVVTLGDCADPSKKNKRLKTPKTTANCMGAADLFKVDARKTILEAMAEYIERHRLLPVELVMRPDVVERLEATPMEITRAVQRVAIVRSRDIEGEELHSIVRQLQELIAQAAAKLFADHKKKVFIDYTEDSFTDTVAALHKQPSADYKLGYLIADGLRTQRSWNDKLLRLISMWAETGKLDEDVRQWAQTVLAAVLEEWLLTPAALKHLTQDAKTSGDALDILLKILEANPDGLPPAGLSLMRAINDGTLQQARRQVLRRVFSLLSGIQRLYPDNLEQELKMLRNFGDRLVKLTNTRYQIEMVQAFEERSNRLMSVDTIEEFLAGTPAVNRPERMLDLADNLVGTTAKSRLCSLIRGEVSQARFEAALKSKSTSPISSLRALRRAQDQLLVSELPKQDVLACVQEIGLLAGRVANETRVFAAIQTRKAPPLDKAAALYQLAANELPRGPAAEYASRTAKKVLMSGEARGQLQQHPDLANMIDDLSTQAQVIALGAA